MPQDMDTESLDELCALLQSVPFHHPMSVIASRTLSTATCSTCTSRVIADHAPFASLLCAMINFGTNSPAAAVAQDSLLQLAINLSSIDPPAVEFSQKLRSHLCEELAISRPLLDNSLILDKAVAVLSNLTRRQIDAQQVFERLGDEKLRDLLNRFDAANRDPTKPQMSFVPSLFVNLSQSESMRRFLMDDSRLVFQRLLPFMDQRFSVSTRGAIMRLVRNCTFDADRHPWLLTEKVGLLSSLLWPLAGPEEYDDEDVQKLPADLQYLPDNKTREPIADLRILLLESLLQLCCTSYGRAYLRDNGAYLILREYHKWEKDPAARIACENVVDPLISDEPAEGLENLRHVLVPDHLAARFDEMNRKLSAL